MFAQINLPTFPTPTEIASAIWGAFWEQAAQAFLDAAAWVLHGLARFVDESTVPNLDAAWFSGPGSPLVVMARIALPLSVMFIFLGVVHAIVTNAGLSEMVRRGIVLPILAAVMGSTGVAVAQMVIDAVGWMSMRMAGGQDPTAGPGAALDRMANLLTVQSDMPAVTAISMGAIAIVLGLFIWMELVVSSAAIYMAMLFFPLSLAALLWAPAASMLRHMVHFLIGLILLRFVVTAVLALASAALVNPQQGPGASNFVVLLGALATLLLAGFAPFVVMRWVPVAVTAAAPGAGRRVLHHVSAPYRRFDSAGAAGAAKSQPTSAGKATSSVRGTATGAATHTAHHAVATRQNRGPQSPRPADGRPDPRPADHRPATRKVSAPQPGPVRSRHLPPRVTREDMESSEARMRDMLDRVRAQERATK